MTARFRYFKLYIIIIIRPAAYVARLANVILSTALQYPNK